MLLRSRLLSVLCLSLFVACTQDGSQAPSPPTNLQLAFASTASGTASPAATWNAAAPVAGVTFASYEFALGTAAGDDSIQAWTDVGESLAAPAVTGIDLDAGTYHLSVRTVVTSAKKSAAVSA